MQWVNKNKTVTRWMFSLFIGLTIIVGSTAGKTREGEPTLDDLLGIKQSPGSFDPQGTGGTVPGDPHPIEIDPEISRELSDEQPADLFDHTVQEMNQAADRLGDRFDAGIETQRLHESIIEKLDQVIAQAKKQDSGGSSGGSSGGGKQQPSMGSAQNVGQRRGASGGQSQGSSGGGSSGAGGAGQAAGLLHSSRAGWGNLPPRLRDELLQGLNERFSSVYKELTGEYYRRLAQEGR